MAIDKRLQRKQRFLLIVNIINATADRLANGNLHTMYNLPGRPCIFSRASATNEPAPKKISVVFPNSKRSPQTATSFWGYAQ